MIAEQAAVDVERQSDLLSAKDQQQAAADQQVLRHMLSRVRHARRAPAFKCHAVSSANQNQSLGAIELLFVCLACAQQVEGLEAAIQAGGNRSPFSGQQAGMSGQSPGPSTAQSPVMPTPQAERPVRSACTTFVFACVGAVVPAACVLVSRNTQQHFSLRRCYDVLQDTVAPVSTASAAMLAAEFHRGLDEIAESCKQVGERHPTILIVVSLSASAS